MIFIPYGTRESTRRQRFPIITLALVIINLAVFGLEAYYYATYGESGLQAFLERFAVIPASFIDGNYVQIGLFTSMFLHGGILHILGNMLYLLPFGDNVEDRMGHLRYLVFYILCGLIATIVYVLFHPDSTVPLVGASGAIAGVLGSYLVLHPRGTVKGFFFLFIILLRVDLPALFFIGYWFLIQVFNSVTTFDGTAADVGGVAFLAHVSGFVAGLLLTPLFARKRPTQGTAPLFP